jgi:hypothetical protein
MSESKLKYVKVINLNLNEDKSSEKISELVKDLRKKGFEELQLTIEGSIINLLEKAGFSIKLFEQIKTKQDLPDWVVYDLIESSGKLKGTDFLGRLKNAD